MNIIVFDIETSNLFSDVGKRDPVALDISVVGVYDSQTDSYKAYLQEEFGKLWQVIEQSDALVGYNSDYFDIPLLNKYYPGDLLSFKSIDLLKEIQKTLGRRIGLDAVAEATLGIGKSAHGIQAVQWWRQGKVKEVCDYCLQDVKVTKDIFEYALKHGEVKYKDAFTNSVESIKIDTREWLTPQEKSVTMSLGF